VRLSDVDSEQRETGALNVYARDTLGNDDELIGQILAAAAPGTIVALVSGHGFENENYVVRPRVLLKPVRRPASEVPVEVQDGLIGTPDGSIAERLRKLMTDGHRHGIAREVPMAEVKAKASSLARPAIARGWPRSIRPPIMSRAPKIADRLSDMVRTWASAGSGPRVRATDRYS